ncbi:MAG TPA: hypothetical protein V6C99_00220 [Oculatellaceae cyanobacterium]
MLAPSQAVESYRDCPNELFTAARAWAARLESFGSPRVYWVTLSEEVRHLHIHLFPRWEGDTLKGIPLFETRNEPNQPAWTPQVKELLREWAARFNVEVIETA